MTIRDQPGISFELLLDYVEGLLDASSRERVEQFLAQDENHQTVVEGIRYYYQEYGASRAELEEYLAEFKQRLVQEHIPTQTRRLSPRLLSIAAAVLGLVLCVFLLRNQILPADSTDQFVANALAEPYGNIYGNQRSNDTNDQQAELGRWYSKGDYQQIITELEQNNTELEATDAFLLAQSYLNLDPPNFTRAAELFEDILNNNAPAALVQQTQWYLALSQYRAGKEIMARETFEKIAQSENHYRQSEARAILKKW